MDIEPLDLLFPNRLSEIGKEFVRAHGLSEAKLADLQEGAILMDTGQVKIQHRCQHFDEMGLCRIYTDRPTICRDYICPDDKCPPICEGDNE